MQLQQAEDRVRLEASFPVRQAARVGLAADLVFEIVVFEIVDQQRRVHDIRHGFALRALALGEGLPIIGRLLGHRRVETTARYAHLARDSVRESAEKIASSIAADIL